MATKRNALSSLISPHLFSSISRLDPDDFIGFHFLLTYADGIEIVKRKNAGGVLFPIFKEDDHLLERQPEQLEECYCFTKLKPAGKNKAYRTFGEGSRRYKWKNSRGEPVRDDKNIVIGWVTKLVLHGDKNTPTEWHITEYKDRNTIDAGRWVLCQIYKREKNNDCGMRPSGARGDMNTGAHYETGQCSYTPPDWGNIYPNQNSNTNSIDMCPNPFSGMDDNRNGDFNPHYEMGQCSNTQPDWVNQYSNTNSIDMCRNQHINLNSFSGMDDDCNGYINLNPFSGVDDDCNGYFNLNPFSGMDDDCNGYINLNPFSGMDDFNHDQCQHYEMDQRSNTQPDWD